MKKFITKPLAITLCMTLVAGSVGAGIYALNNITGSDDEPKAENSLVLSNNDNSDEKTAEKDETVYVLAGADGSVKKIIVSDWIKNALGSDSLNDKSELSDIENVKGDESYKMDGDTMRVWDAKGNDIYYQGNISKELPVQMTVTYTLDESVISPSELKGKSGHLTIRFDYKNNQYEMVEIDGEEEKIYVPFAMLTGMLLDNEVFTNVDVSNGKLINDGNRTAVIGIALPGLQSNLNIAKENLEIPDYVEISADVKNFEMSNTVTIATNELFNHFDIDNIDSFDSLEGSLGELAGAMKQLTDGSSELYNGLNTLLSKSKELVSGIDKLASGAKELKDGVGTLDSGAAELASGAKDLASGLDQLSSNNQTLNDGSKKVFESLLSTANTQLAAAGLSVPTLTIENYSSVLDNVIASLDESAITKQANAAALNQVTEAVNAKKSEIKAAVTSAVRAEVEPKVEAAVKAEVKTKALAASGMTPESYEAGIKAGLITKEQQAQIDAAVEAQMASDTVKALVKKNTDAKMQSSEIQALISSKTEEQVQTLINQNMNSEEVKNKIKAAIESAKSGVASIKSLKGQLDEYNKFYTGLRAYTDGVKSADDGANKLSSGASDLKNGTATLYNGVNELYNGILTLKNGAPALVSGVTELRNGSLKLSDGLKEFNEQGVQKLIDAVDGNLEGVVTRIKATADVSKDYKSFSGISDEMDGQVKFIYRTDSID